MFGERAVDKPGEVARIGILLLDSDAEYGAEHSRDQFVSVRSAAELAVGDRLVEHVVDDYAGSAVQVLTQDSRGVGLIGGSHHHCDELGRNRLGDLLGCATEFAVQPLAKRAIAQVQ
ncbi:hypothetical protein MDUV_30150 [Mycolicibacterium duvalii]|uniref:Uncharacterized protein n=1 Tax=Mycolicibacterium duvalii TaxID=39688 RepID=A0A7I7K275_9MYCO|nr:hypothetical protein [Mycolicibacterium duvalii]BBX18155.1 hypothetical protein MDUV_30150 [Mycolicibacterium duvalii]